MVIAIDYDGTIINNDAYPNKGVIRPGAAKVIKWLKSKGATLILWTCREGEELEDAVQWCSIQGITFDAVNDNLPEIIEQYGRNSRKISCDLYIDDKAVAGNVYKLLEG